MSPGVGTTLGHLRLDPLDCEQAGEWASGSESATCIDASAARKLASAISGMLNELMETRHALWQREADLAASIPVPSHSPDSAHLAERLDAVLKGGAEAVGCQAAALYLLDEATTELKVRSCWGLPFDQLMSPARSLKGAIADLEALLGHAVVLEDAKQMPQWNPPEDFRAAVCVPVSTATSLLGTLWVFSNEPRDFSPRQTNLLEIVAGRLAVELEREALIREGADSAATKREMVDAERLQRNQMPRISPILDGWQLAGWASQAKTVGGAFYDWFCLPKGAMAAVVGDLERQGVEGAMGGAGLRAALRAHGQYHRQSRQTLKQVNLSLWTGSVGDQHASLFYGIVETATGRVCCSVAGSPSILLMRPHGWRSLTVASSYLGTSPEAEHRRFTHNLRPGETLVIFNRGVREAIDADDIPLGEPGVAEIALSNPRLSAEELASAIRERISQHTTRESEDQAVLVIKRTVP